MERYCVTGMVVLIFSDGTGNYSATALAKDLDYSDLLANAPSAAIRYHSNSLKGATRCPSSVTGTMGSQITELLKAWNNGDPAALEAIVPLVEAQLRQIARRYMRKEEKGHLLQTTALVNEAFLKLMDQRAVTWQNRAHFFAIAAQCMRRVLLNHARAEHRAKRGGKVRPVSLSHAENCVADTNDELIALDEALKRLSAVDERKSKIVELRYFGGLTVEETAEVLQISPITVMRHWNLARAWLRREISRM